MSVIKLHSKFIDKSIDNKMGAYKTDAELAFFFLMSNHFGCTFVLEEKVEKKYKNKCLEK